MHQSENVIHLYPETDIATRFLRLWMYVVTFRYCLEIGGKVPDTDEGIEELRKRVLTVVDAAEKRGFL